MPDFSFLDDGQRDDSTIRINTNAPLKLRRNPARPRTFSQGLDDAQRGLAGCGKQLMGCGCLLVILGLLGLAPFLLLVL